MRLGIFRLLSSLYLLSSLWVLPLQAHEDVPPLISIQEQQQLQTALSDWLQYYQLDLKDFSSESQTVLTLDQGDGQDNHYYGDSYREQGIPSTLLGFSPDKRHFVPLLADVIDYDSQNHTYQEMRDDSQDVWLYDTKLKRQYKLGFYGLNTTAEAVVWLNDHSFVVLSTMINGDYDPDELDLRVRQYYIQHYDLTKKHYNVYRYDALIGGGIVTSYFYENLRQKGIVLASNQ